MRLHEAEEIYFNRTVCYTDYPVTSFGDKESEPAPRRKCYLFGIPKGKYAETIVVDNDRYAIAYIKTGYLYKNKKEEK
jgi:hypothetical protein